MPLERLVPGLTPEGRIQAALGEQLGGLNARRLHDQAIACELAVKLVVRAKIRDVDEMLTRAGFIYGGDLT
eukprot:8610441-Lingulodinium_polyedra.AAC.1